MTSSELSAMHGRALVGVVCEILDQIMGVFVYVGECFSGSGVDVEAFLNGRSSLDA